MDKKKLAAAMAAVFAYIKTSEEAAASYIPGTAESGIGQMPQPQQVLQQPNFWGVSGRQDQMQRNSMMQLRMFK